MALFSPDQVAFGDVAGYGQWLNLHWNEHQQFIGIGLAHTPVVQFVAYDILSWGEDPGMVQAWKEAHMAMHYSLRRFTAVDGFDYRDFDLGQPEDFYNFLQYHAVEHAQLRQVFGVH